MYVGRAVALGPLRHMLAGGGEIDHLGDVGRVVAHPLQILGDKEEVGGGGDVVRILHHEGQERAEDAVIEVVDRAVSFADQNSLVGIARRRGIRSEEHTSELQTLMRISYDVFSLKKT